MKSKITHELPLSFTRAEKKELFRIACKFDANTGKEDHYSMLMHKLLMIADEAPEMMRALTRISTSEVRPNKQGKVDLSDVQDLQRIARIAVSKVKLK